MSGTMIKDAKEYLDMRVKSLQLSENKEGSISLLQLESKIDEFVSSAWDVECSCQCALCAKCCNKIADSETPPPSGEEEFLPMAIPLPRPNSYPVPEATGTKSVENSVLGGLAGWKCINSDSTNAMSVCLTGTNAGYNQSLSGAYDLWSRIFSSRATISSTVYLYVVNIFILNSSTQTQTIVSTNTNLTTDGAISIVGYQDNNHIGSQATVVACDPAGSAPSAGIPILPGQVCELRVQFLSTPTTTSGTSVIAKVFGILTPALA